MTCSCRKGAKCADCLGLLDRPAESPWKTLSRERWDADYGEGDYDRRLAEAKEVERANQERRDYEREMAELWAKR